ncbi:MAG: SDR family oxidoreductase [Methanothrix sp.]|nr:SDR family oxidoreductase [Methanothrix sp.]
MKLLITGGSGLLGSKVAEIALARGDEVFSGYAHNMPSYGKPVRFDLLDVPDISDMLERLAPEVIIHSAALTDVDRCEREKDLAYKMNVEGTRAIAAAAEKVGSFLIYISTDYVFDGLCGMYREDDIPNPVSYYGYSKLLGEQFCRGCIARTCVIYGSRPASGKVNFALWLLSSLKSGKQVRVVTDQFITPTLNTNLAAMVLEAADRRLCGVYNLAGATRISRYYYALELAREFDLDASLILPSRMEELLWAAKRPIDSSLDTSKAKRELMEKPLPLNEALRTLKAEVLRAEISRS